MSRTNRMGLLVCLALGGCIVLQTCFSPPPEFAPKAPWERELAPPAYVETRASLLEAHGGNPCVIVSATFAPSAPTADLTDVLAMEWHAAWPEDEPEPPLCPACGRSLCPACGEEGER